MAKKNRLLLLIPILSLASCASSISKSQALLLLDDMNDPQVEGEYSYWTITVSYTSQRDGVTDKSKGILEYGRDGSYRGRYERETINTLGESSEKKVVDYRKLPSLDGYENVIYAECTDNDGYHIASTTEEMYQIDPTPFIFWSSTSWDLTPSTYNGETFKRIEFDEDFNSREYHVIYKYYFYSSGNGNLTIKESMCSFNETPSAGIVYQIKESTEYKYNNYYIRSYSRSSYSFDENGRQTNNKTIYKASFKYSKELSIEIPSNWRDYLVVH